jgi:hypothetical protein
LRTNIIILLPALSPPLCVIKLAISLLAFSASEHTRF